MSDVQPSHPLPSPSPSVFPRIKVRVRLNGNRARGSGLAIVKESAVVKLLILDGSCSVTHPSFPQFSDPLSDFQSWMLNFGLK